MLATLVDAPPTTPLALVDTAEPGSLPSLSNVLFDFTIPSAEAPAAAPFTVDSFSKASWCASRILESQARVDQRADLAKSYIERIRSWLDSANAADIDSIDYLSSLLKPWVEAEVAKQRRSRSVLLPTGTAQLRKLPDKVEIVNLNAALAYCKENLPGIVITREDLSKTELKKAVFDGNAIPGVEAQLGRDELFIRPAVQA